MVKPHTVYENLLFLHYLVVPGVEFSAEFERKSGKTWKYREKRMLKRIAKTKTEKKKRKQ